MLRAQAHDKLSQDEGHSYRRMSALGLGCVKTPKFNMRVEIPSRFRRFGKPTALAITVGRRQ